MAHGRGRHAGCLIVWRDPRGRHFVLPPCGRCREVIRDFNRDARVIVSARRNHRDADAIDHPRKVRASDLLPSPGEL